MSTNRTHFTFSICAQSPLATPIRAVKYHGGQQSSLARHGDRSRFSATILLSQGDVVGGSSGVWSSSIVFAADPSGFCCADPWCADPPPLMWRIGRDAELEDVSLSRPNSDARTGRSCPIERQEAVQCERSTEIFSNDPSDPAGGWRCNCPWMTECAHPLERAMDVPEGVHTFSGGGTRFFYAQDRNGQ